MHGTEIIPREERTLGAEYGRQARTFYPGRAWLEVEPLLRRLWEQAPHAADWTRVKPIVHATWSDASV